MSERRQSADDESPNTDRPAKDGHVRPFIRKIDCGTGDTNAEATDARLGATGGQERVDQLLAALEERFR